MNDRPLQPSMRMPMIFRFSLYGFLKNQRYFEPFFILFLREKGLSFTSIGLLVMFREIAVFVMEVPTGAFADVFGRRKSMIMSFLAYIVSFVLFYRADRFLLFFPAMFFFAVGDAYRTGTHKAIIFSWLHHENRAGEKTEVYGFTRSWSKLGSAFSLPIAAAIVYCTGRYADAFLFSIIPYLLNLVNFCTYPAYLDRSGDPENRHAASVTAVIRTLSRSVKNAMSNRRLRQLLLESMNYEGIFKSTKEYLQPILKSFALSLFLLPGLSPERKTAVVVGVVYIVLHLLGSAASRYTGRFARRAGGEQRAARLLWLLNFIIFATLFCAIYLDVSFAIIACFILIATLENFWRPILVSRCATLSNPAETATILSIESQLRNLFSAALAPVLGFCVDAIAAHSPDIQFLPVAALGMIVAFWMCARRRPEQPRAARQ